MSDKPKLLYIVTQKELGGAARYIITLAKHLSTEYEIHIASGTDGNNDYLKIEARKLLFPYYEIRSLKRSISPVYDVKALFEIYSLYKKINPHIAHLNSSKVGVIGSIAGFFHPVVTLYTAHGWVTKEPLPNILRYLYFIMEAIAGHINKKTICLFKGDAEYARRKGIVSSKNLTVIQNGVPFEDIAVLEKDEAKNALKKRGVDTAKKIALTIANLYKTKNLETIIDTALRAHEYSFVIIGEGPERSYLENLITKKKCRNVYLLGSITNASELLNAADVFVLTSVKEGMPLTVLEALAAEIPIVATRVGAIPELLSSEHLIHPRRPDELLEKLKMPLRVPPISKDTISIQRQVALTKALYNELLKTL